jgi:hypothetical protein
MNTSKAKVLEVLDQSARVHDASLERGVDVMRHPELHGWRRSLLTAAIVLPLTAVSATLTDLARVCVARSDDDAWDQDDPKPPTPPAALEDGAAPPAVDT